MNDQELEAQIEAELTHDDYKVRCEAIQEYNLTDDQKERALTDEDESVRWMAVNQGWDLTKEQEERALIDKSSHVRFAAISQDLFYP